jgi:hypothetical protein
MERIEAWGRQVRKNENQQIKANSSFGLNGPANLAKPIKANFRGAKPIFRAG